MKRRQLAGLGPLMLVAALHCYLVALPIGYVYAAGWLGCGRRMCCGTACGWPKRTPIERPRSAVPLYMADLGMEHVYIKPRTPQLNGKVERSHRTDKDEFYQRLSYRDDVDLDKKLAVWERFYNFDRPHGAHGGKSPYAALREKLS